MDILNGFHVNKGSITDSIHVSKSAGSHYDKMAELNLN